MRKSFRRRVAPPEGRGGPPGGPSTFTGFPRSPNIFNDNTPVGEEDIRFNKNQFGGSFSFVAGLPTRAVHYSFVEKDLNNKHSPTFTVQEAGADDRRPANPAEEAIIVARMEQSLAKRHNPDLENMLPAAKSMLQPPKTLKKW